MSVSDTHTESRRKRATGLLEELVRFRSLSGEESAVADWLESFLTRSGLDVRRVDDNLWFTIGTGEDRLLLNSHLDVVPASDGHPYSPFEPTIVDERLYGRGSVDAKGCVTAMTVAAIELLEAGWEPEGGQLLVAFTACEESGGSYNGLNELRSHLPRLSAAIIGEPTSLEPVTSQKGLLILRAVSSGRSSHAARPALGKNAILGAAEDIVRLSAYRPERIHPILGPVTITVTTIDGGSARNVVPDTCTFYLDVRSTPAYTHEELIGEIAGQIESRIEIHSDRLVPVETSVDERIVTAVLEAVPATEPIGSPTLSDWVFVRDLPTVKIGPGDSPLSHTADEHMPLDSLEEGVGAYRRIIETYFRNVP